MQDEDVSKYAILAMILKEEEQQDNTDEYAERENCRKNDLCHHFHMSNQGI